MGTDKYTESDSVGLPGGPALSQSSTGARPILSNAT